METRDEPQNLDVKGKTSNDVIVHTLDEPRVDTIRIDAYTYIQQANGTRTRGNLRDYATISIVATP